MKEFKEGAGERQSLYSVGLLNMKRMRRLGNYLGVEDGQRQPDEMEWRQGLERQVKHIS